MNEDADVNFTAPNRFIQLCWVIKCDLYCDSEIGCLVRSNQWMRWMWGEVDENAPAVKIICVSLCFCFLCVAGVPFLITAELFKQSHRPAAYTVAGCLNWLSNFTIGFVFPFLEVCSAFTFNYSSDDSQKGSCGSACDLFHIIWVTNILVVWILFWALCALRIFTSGSVVAPRAVSGTGQ